MSSKNATLEDPASQGLQPLQAAVYRQLELGGHGVIFGSRLEQLSTTRPSSKQGGRLATRQAARRTRHAIQSACSETLSGIAYNLGIKYFFHLYVHKWRGNSTQFRTNISCAPALEKRIQEGGVDPWETGSYDIALEQAGLANFNIVTYSSCMPVEAVEISREASNNIFHHGAVCEVIMARMDGACGDRISAGVARCNVKTKDGRKVSGFAAEYRGHATEAMVKQILREDIEGIFNRRYSKDHEMEDIQYTIIVKEVEKSFGTVLASVCFASYIHPVLAMR